MDNLCILVFQLAGFDPISCISHLIYGHIKPYFPGGLLGNNIGIIEIEVNIGIKEFKAQMNEFPQRLLQYVS